MFHRWEHLINLVLIGFFVSSQIGSPNGRNNGQIINVDLLHLFFIYFLIFFLNLRNTHTNIYIYIYGKGDEIREYTHTPIPKLHAAVSFAEQVINPFSILYLTDVG